MKRVEESEVVAGLVVHLDTTSLRTRGDVETNAEVAPTGDRAVQGPHYFLIVDVDQAAKLATAMPLYSNQAPGSELLDESRKAGLASKWIGAPSNVSRFQHWRLPTSAIPGASGTKESSALDRRTYALGDAKELARLRALEAGSRAKYRRA